MSDRLGLPLETLQAFEGGSKRMAPSALWQAAEVLGVSVIRFFQDGSADGDDPKEIQDMLRLFENLSHEEIMCVLNRIHALSSSVSNQFQPPPFNQIQ